MLAILSAGVTGAVQRRESHEPVLYLGDPGSFVKEAAKMPDPEAYVILDSSAQLLDVLKQMVAHAVRYAVVNYGPKFVVYSNEGVAAALETGGAKALRDVLPYRTLESSLLESMKQMSGLTLDMRGAIGICSDNHSTPSPPAYLGGTCRCSKKIVLVV